MTKENYIENATESKNKIELFKVFCKNNADYTQYIAQLDSLIEWLNKVIDDYTNDVIPSEYYDIVYGLLKNLETNILPETNDEYRPEKIWFHHMAINTFIINLSSKMDIISTYLFCKSINFAIENVVIVGANGSGKTSLANIVKQSLRKENAIVIPAQKMLIFPTLTFSPILSSTEKSFRESQSKIFNPKITYNLNNQQDIPYDFARQLSDSIKNLFIMLIAQRAQANAKCGRAARQGMDVNKSMALSTIDKVISIWNSLIEHRKLECNDDNQLIVLYDGNSYPAYQMSDGEKEILYLVAEVMLAPQKALIVVDEPEMHLHKSIVDKLWDLLEKERQDCIFIYLTHDLEFAVSRNARKCWIKSFEPPQKWEIKEIEPNELPEDLYLKLLGSRKRILFCEGTKDSIDYKIYNLLFPNYTVTPVGSCKNVIFYTRLFNKVKDRYADAYGMIDRDFKSDEELDKLKTDKVYSYNFAEIENVLLEENVILKMKKHFLNNDVNIDQIKDSIIHKFKKEIPQQSAKYVERQILNALSAINSVKGNNIDIVKTNFEFIINNIKIVEWNKQRQQELNKMYSDKDYVSILKAYNNKGLHSVVASALKVGEYQKKTIEYFTRYGIPDSVKQFFPGELLE